MNDNAHARVATDESKPAQHDASRLESEAAAKSASWRKHLLIFSGLLLAAMALFGASYWSMVTTWWRSETFAHGFIVVPISVYLALRKRETLRDLWPRAEPTALLILVVLGLAWVFGNAADVLGVTQLAVTAMIPALVVLVFGWAIARALAFPLAFLLLAVPIGEFLVPPLIDITAWFTVHALQLTGVPVYWEGNRFSLPSGEWSVVKACSGVRYLYATLTVALLYVYLNYRSRWRQIAFVMIAIALSIFGNGLRAYGIVMIGHLSEMRLAVGIDHFIYGWVFFALLMVLLFWIGSLLRGRDSSSGERVAENRTGSTGVGGTMGRALVTAFGGLVVLVVFPAWATHVESNTPNSVTAEVSIPQLQGGWKHASDDPITDWQPIYVNPTATLSEHYQKGSDAVGLFIAYYGAQRQGSELINFQNVLVKESDAWHIIGKRSAEVSVAGETQHVKERRLRSARGDLLVWQWYWVNGSHLDSKYVVKLREAIDRLMTGQRRGAGIVVYTHVDHDEAAARERLQDFATHALQPLDEALAQTMLNAR